MTATRFRFFHTAIICLYFSLSNCSFAQITAETIASADIKDLKTYIQKIKEDKIAVSNSSFQDKSPNRLVTLLTGDNELINARNEAEFNQSKAAQIRALDSLLSQAESRVTSIATGYLSSSKFTEELDKNGGKLSNSELSKFLEFTDFLPDSEKSALAGSEPQKVIASLTALSYQDKETMNLYWSYVLNKLQEEAQKDPNTKYGVTRDLKLSHTELSNIASLMLSALASDDSQQIDLIGRRFAGAIDHMMSNHMFFIKPGSLDKLTPDERFFAVISFANHTNDSRYFVTMGTSFQKLYKDTKKKVVVQTTSCIVL